MAPNEVGEFEELPCEDLLEAANAHIKELEEAMHKMIPEEFKKASQISGHHDEKLDNIWIIAEDAYLLFHMIRSARDKAANEWKLRNRIVFAIEPNGRIKSATLDEEPAS